MSFYISVRYLLAVLSHTLSWFICFITISVSLAQSQSISSSRFVTVLQRSSRQLHRQPHYSLFVAAAAICYYCYYLYALLFVRLPIVICIKSLIKLLPRSVASVGCTSTSSSINCCRVNRFNSLLSRDHLSTCTN